MSKYFQQLSATAQQGLTILVIGDHLRLKWSPISNLLGLELTQYDSCDIPKVSGLTVTTFKRNILGFLWPSTRHAGQNRKALLNIHLQRVFAHYSIVQMEGSLQS